jgi:hypothetical protein
MQRPMDQLVLQSLRESGLIFVSAQPDNTYFHWQVELYLYQFAKHGLSDMCYAVIGYSGDSPTAYALKLANKYPHILFYKDTRTLKQYSPSIRPHILAKFFAEYPQFQKNVFYHDSDIFLTKLPRFDLMLSSDDNKSYVSDTKSYIGYEYIKKCADRYKTKHKNLPDLDIFYGMCNVLGINPGIVIANQENSGGAQYLLKNIDQSFWVECEKKCVELYSYFCNYEKKYPIDHHIQKWTTDMWVVLWLYWKRGGHTVIHKELDFSWGTGTINDYNDKNIFHLAGVTNANCSDKFHKGKFTNILVFDAYLKNPKLFNNIRSTGATLPYTNVIREYVEKIYSKKTRTDCIIDSYKLKNNGQRGHELKNNGQRGHELKNNGQREYDTIKEFTIKTKCNFAGIYKIDNSKICCGKNIWRSTNDFYLIFWNGMHWILTESRYENKIGQRCGGLASSSANYPFMDGWNISDIGIIY